MLVLSAVSAMPAGAPRGGASGTPQQPHKPPKQQERKQDRPPRPLEKRVERAGPAARGDNRGTSNSAGAGANRPNFAPRTNGNPNRPPSAYTPPPPRKFNELSPQEKQKVIENNNKLRNLSPAQRQELKERVEVWNKMTPEQRSHIRNDVLPTWRQMPLNRRQAIQQRLRVLQNMPESARNQRLNDPDFTKGMSEEDKATLRDLSHLHVGGAPDPPGE